MKFRLPYPPSANAYWRAVGGRVLVSREARAYKQAAMLRARAQGVKPIVGPVAVIVSAFRPRRCGDIDNTLKVALDSLKGVAYQDDAQIVELHAIRHDDKADPRLEVTIESLSAVTVCTGCDDVTCRHCAGAAC